MRVRVKKRGASYQITAVLGHNDNGNEVRHYYTRRTKKEADALAAELVKQAALNTYSQDRRTSVKDFAARWLADKRNLRSNTRLQYEQMLNLHILPALGDMRLSALNDDCVDDFINAVAAKGLAPKTVHTAFTTLRAMLNWAVKKRRIGSNPCLLVDAPEVPKKEADSWTAEQAAAYLAALQGEPLHALFYLTVKHGLRRGEALGLRWCDLDGNRLRIRRAVEYPKGHLEVQEVKTPDSWRVIPLSPSTLALLREHRKWQLEYRFAHGMGMPREDGWVFHSRNDTPIHTRTLYRAHSKAIAKAGLPYITPHGLRHTTATILLAQGVPDFYVARLLGHSDSSITSRIYGHTIDEVEQEVAATMDRALGHTNGEALVTKWAQAPRNVN